MSSWWFILERSMTGWLLEIWSTRLGFGLWKGGRTYRSGILCWYFWISAMTLVNELSDFSLFIPILPLFLKDKNLKIWEFRYESCLFIS
ncbi:hypothetical protein Hdeb2414_s0001g00029511 [Helianthus debilis subsp. tardiflorus]